MGWFFVNIVLPIVVPLAFLFLAKFVDLPEPYASRAKLIRAVQDGQLGWVAIGFAAACAYEILEEMSRNPAGAPAWAGLVFGIACVFLAVSGFLATLGTLYPVDESQPAPTDVLSWVRRYRLFLGTAVATLVTAALFSIVHYALPEPCRGSECVVKSHKGG